MRINVPISTVCFIDRNEGPTGVRLPIENDCDSDDVLAARK